MELGGCEEVRGVWGAGGVGWGREGHVGYKWTEGVGI